MVGDFDGFPIEKITGFFALDFAHEPAAGVSAGISGRFGHRGLDPVRLPESTVISEGEAKASVGIDVMEFEVLGFEPRVAPFEALALAEFAEEIFLGDPV